MEQMDRAALEALVRSIVMEKRGTQNGYRQPCRSGVDPGSADSGGISPAWLRLDGHGTDNISLDTEL